MNQNDCHCHHPTHILTMHQTHPHSLMLLPISVAVLPGSKQSLLCLPRQIIRCENHTFISITTLQNVYLTVENLPGHSNCNKKLLYFTHLPRSPPWGTKLQTPGQAGSPTDKLFGTTEDAFLQAR